MLPGDKIQSVALTMGKGAAVSLAVCVVSLIEAGITWKQSQ